MIYHVAKNGSDRNPGTAAAPFLTISRAAKIADEGDTVRVHEGIYRETVAPARGARSELGRITYEAAKGERVSIRGSEIIENWAREGAVFHATVENSLFGRFNPFAELLDGDWMARPLSPETRRSIKHLGCVYCDEEALIEATSMEELSAKPMTWFARVGDEATEIWVNLGERSANDSVMEINVRKTCFYPENRGLNYITVRFATRQHPGHRPLWSSLARLA